MTPNPNPSPELLKTVSDAAVAYAAFVEARNRMNAAVPAIDGTKAERDLYDERYKADHTAEREHFRTAISLSHVASDVFAALSQTLPAPGEVGFPDIGPDPMKGDRVDRIEQAVAACREAYVKQQKGVPDQTALVWRWHLGALLECATRLKAILSRDTTEALATVAAANDEGNAK